VRRLTDWLKIIRNVAVSNFRDLRHRVGVDRDLGVRVLPHRVVDDVRQDRYRQAHTAVWNAFPPSRPRRWLDVARGATNESGAVTDVQGMFDLSRGRLHRADRPTDLAGATHLDLSYNDLTELPGWVGELGSLVWLDLSHNHLAGLPESIGDLSQLVTLNLGHNRLTALPSAIGNLAALADLRLEDNQLATLPETFANLGALSRLTLDDNPFPNIPQHLPPGIALFDLNEGRSAW
jgi:hypothetical protein